VGVNIAAQEIFVPEILSTTAITVEPVQHLRYFACYLVGASGLPLKAFRWQGRPVLAKADILRLQCARWRNTSFGLLSLEQIDASREEQRCAEGEEEERGPRLFWGDLFLLCCPGGRFGWLAFLFLSHG